MVYLVAAYVLRVNVSTLIDTKISIVKHNIFFLCYVHKPSVFFCVYDTGVIKILHIFYIFFIVD